MQCWRMLRALRSHGRCWLVVSSDEMSPYTSRSRTSSVTDRRLITDLSTAPYDQKDLCVFCRTYIYVESFQQNTAGPLKRPSSSTVAPLHDITGSFASCYKSHRLQSSNSSATTTLCSLINTTSIMSFRVLPLLSRISLLAVVPWRHHLVMILWLNSQQNRFCDRARKATYRCQRLKANIYNNIYNNIVKCQPPDWLCIEYMFNCVWLSNLRVCVTGDICDPILGVS